MPPHALKNGQQPPNSTEMPMIWKVKQHMQTHRAHSTRGVQGHLVLALVPPCEITAMRQFGPPAFGSLFF